MLFPEPLIVDVTPAVSVPGHLGVHAWTSYVTPAATWVAASQPVPIAFGNGALLPGISLEQATAALDVSTRAWSTVACTGITFSIVSPRAVIGDGSGDGHNDVIVHVDEWPTSLEAGAVAHTVIRVAGDKILEADVHLNAKDYRYALGNVAGASDLRAVLTHELGHVVGIGHSDVARATMNASLPAGLAARSLEDDDRAAICALYPAPPTAKGCDHGSPCPAAYSCIGHGCEIAAETSNLGAQCDDTTHAPDRCDGAGDHSPCVPTTVGERCTVRCDADVDAGEGCGAALHCVTIDGDRWCVPLDADALPDTGIDAGDAGGDVAHAPDAASSGGCGVASTGASNTSGGWWLALALACVIRWRR